MFNIKNKLKKKYNILVIGADGMLGYDLTKMLKEQQQDKNSKIGIVVALGDEFDMTDYSQLSKYFVKTSSSHPIKYDYVINCAALTDTYKIEHDVAYQTKAFNVNAKSVKNLAELCERYHTKLIHISTDYVYSQYSTTETLKYEGNTVLEAFHKNNASEYPINTYGMQKLIAEDFIRQKMNNKHYAILRTSWLYGNHNHKSFIHKIILNYEKQYKLHADNDFAFEVTSNEYSIPTSTRELSIMILNVINYNLYGIFAACGRAINPDCSNYAINRYEFAKTILQHYYSLSKKLMMVNSHLSPIVREDILNPTYSRMYNEPIDEQTKNLISNEKYSIFNWFDELKNFINENHDDIEKWVSDSIDKK